MAGTRIGLAGPGQPATTKGAISIQRDLVGGGSVEEVTWETEDKLACSLELVIQIVEIAGVGLTPLNMCSHLRWQVWSWSHGETTYSVPPNLAQTAGPNPGSVVQFPQWCILARGVVARMEARGIRLTLGNDVANTRALIRCSIQPLPGADSDRWPFPMFDSQPVGGRGFFPIGAREWRLLPQGPNDFISTYAFSNDAAPTLLQTQNTTYYADWKPIGDREYSWQTNGVISTVEYR